MRLALLLSAQLPHHEPGFLASAVSAAEAPVKVIERASFVMEHRPEALSSGPPNTDARVQWLFLKLQRAGVEGIVLPVCPGCGVRRPVPRRSTVRGASVRVCSTCFDAARRGVCPVCKKVRVLAGKVGGEPSCRACASRPALERTCSVCQRTTRFTRERQGRLICLNCIEKPRHECSVCGKHRPRARVIGAHGVCGSCYARITNIAETCPQCRQERIVAYRSPTHTRVCASCAGEPPRYCCVACGREGRRFKGNCGPCAVRRVGEQMRSAHPGSDPRWQDFFELLAEHQTVDGLVLWLNRPTTRLRLESLMGDLEGAAQHLRTIPSSRSRRYLESLLVSAGLLSQLDVFHWQIEDLLEELTKDLASESRLLLAQFTRWRVMKRVQHPFHRPRENSTPSLRHWHQEMTAAAEFLSWSSQQAGASRDLDDRALWVLFTQTRPTLRTSFRGFANWYFGSPRRSPVALQPHRTHNPVLGDDEHLQMLRRIVSDDQVRLDLRCVVALVGLFGVPVRATCELLKSQFEATDESISVRFGTVPVEIPAPFDEVIRSQLKATNPRQAAFIPGRAAASTITTTTIAKAAREQLGVSLRALRQAGLEHLLTSVPAGVVADVTGYTAASLSRIASRIGRPWSDYPLLRQVDNQQ